MIEDSNLWFIRSGFQVTNGTSSEGTRRIVTKQKKSTKEKTTEHQLTTQSTIELGATTPHHTQPCTDQTTICNRVPHCPTVNNTECKKNNFSVVIYLFFLISFETKNLKNSLSCFFFWYVVSLLDESITLPTYYNDFPMRESSHKTNPWSMCLSSSKMVNFWILECKCLLLFIFCQFLLLFISIKAEKLTFGAKKYIISPPLK